MNNTSLICFSLWGDNPVYLQGALRNADLAAVHYPDWLCRFYCASDVDPKVVRALQNHPHCKVVIMAPAADRLGAFWRFFASEDEGVSHVIFRDADSRISAREAAAVGEWLASGKPFHIMRDHPFHWPAIMAGMWGCKGGSLTGWKSNYQVAIAQHAAMQAYGGDQTFLADAVYPQIKSQCLIHDSIGISEPGLDTRPFPVPRDGLEFVGQSFDSHDQPNTHYAHELSIHLEQQPPSS